MTEDQLEQQCLEWFAEGGWEIGHGPDLAPDGPTPERAVAVVRKPASLDVVISNRAFHRLLLDGAPVEYKRDDKVIHDHQPDEFAS